METIDLSGFKTVHTKPRGILWEKRVTQNMTQQQVADKAGIKLQQYQKLESGERNIMRASFQLACKVIEALGMNVSDFFHGEYCFGEEVYLADGLRYKKTGRLTGEDIK